MKTGFTILALLMAYIGFSQIYFFDFDIIPCPFGEGTVTAPAGWEVYQTENDEWDGDPIDDVCVDFLLSDGIPQLNLSQAISGRPIFIRKEFNYSLVPNSLYFIEQYANFGNLLQIDCSSLETCSGIRLLVEKPAHPDSTAEMTLDQNFIAYKPPYPTDNWFSSAWFNSCLVTEYFENQKLVGLVLELRPNWSLVQPFLKFGSIYFFHNDNMSWYPLPIYQTNLYDLFSYAQTGAIHKYSISYEYMIHCLFGYDPNTGYPSASNPYYIEFEPFNGQGSSEQEQILLTTDEWNNPSSLIFQPHVMLRGALVQGEDELRHLLEIDWHDSEYCGPFSIIDHIIHPEVRLTLGNIGFEFGPEGCLLFQPESVLKVKEKSSAHYGTSGLGMMALMDNSKMILETESRFQIGNMIGLFDHSAPSESGTYTDVFLHPYSRLTFRQGSSIKNGSPGERMKIRLNMLGGTVDFSGLPPADLRHFEFVYPETPSNATLEILGNPARSEIRFRWWSAEDGTVSIELFDLSGRALASEQLAKHQGWNYRILPLSPNESGIVLLRLTEAGRATTAKVVVE